MDQASPERSWRIRAVALRERLRAEFGRRAVGIVLALVAELLLLLALLSLNQSVEPPQGAPIVVDFSAKDYSEPAPEEPEPEPAKSQPDSRPTPQPVETAVPVVPQPIPPPAIVIPRPTAAPAPPPVERPRAPAAVVGPAYGPPDPGSRAGPDSVRVGTAPDGSPLYAARWYREPGQEFWGFLSSASPGWGMVACRTIPNFYVTDCVPVGESPGSMLNRSILAGAGVLRVRPAQLGGRVLVGSWVRIKIDYTIVRE